EPDRLEEVERKLDRLLKVLEAPAQHPYGLTGAPMVPSPPPPVAYPMTTPPTTPPPVAPAAGRALPTTVTGVVGPKPALTTFYRSRPSEDADRLTKVERRLDQVEKKLDQVIRQI